jgi:hypothetical protein
VPQLNLQDQRSALLVRLVRSVSVRRQSRRSSRAPGSSRA